MYVCVHAFFFLHFLHILHAVYSYSLYVHKHLDEDLLRRCLHYYLCGTVLAEVASHVRPDRAVLPTHPTLLCLTGSVGMCHPISYLEQDLWGQGRQSSSSRRGTCSDLINIAMQIVMLKQWSFTEHSCFSKPKLKMPSRRRNLDYVSIWIL